jgi:hypothetical protein
MTACGPSPEAGDASVPTADAGASDRDTRQWEHYGESFAGDETIPASTLLDDPSAYVDQTVLVEGRVADVCQEKGCWMVITDEERHMRVVTKDHAYGVNKKSQGWECQVKGTVVATQIDPETVAHYESESSKGAVVPEKQAQGEVTYELIADGVKMCPPSG